MRLKGRQGRFLGATIGGWIAARIWLLWPAPVAIGGAVMTAASLGGLTVPHFIAEPGFVPMRVPNPLAPPVAPMSSLPPVAIDARPPSPAMRRTQQGRTMLLAFDGGFATTPQRLLRQAVHADRAPSPPPAPQGPVPVPVEARGGRSIEGQAYLFLRPGSGRATLAPGGSLGGSQVAARVAVALNRTGPVRTAVAARLYAPLHGKGAEAALGLDWHPLAGVPLRVSIERRIGLDAAGRDAWSAYAAGGFYAGHLPLGLEADGYGQAGVVGSRARNLFVDGAVRVGRRIGLGRAAAVIGAGAWGAAQPDAARFDIGPRIAVSLPVDRHRLTLAVEGRLRIAGAAAPGSGAALTLATDF